ncbi:restriction endonuclease subunit S [Microbacterium foliorum]
MTMSELALPQLLSAVIDNRGRSCPTAQEGVPLIATNCIRRDLLFPTFENVRYVDDVTYRTWFRGHPAADDIIFVCKGDPGRTALVPDPVPFVIAQDMVSLRPNRTRIAGRYLLYALRSPLVQERIKNLHVGTMIPHFKKGDFGKLLVPVHDSLAEQQAIAEVLGALDDKIVANISLANATDRYLASLFEKSVSTVPDVHLGTVADVNSSTVRPTAGGSLRYIDVSSVGVGSMDYPNRSAWDDAPTRARRRVAPGDTVWSTVRPNRRSHALVLDDEPELVASTGLAVLSPRTIGYAYLYEATKRPAFTAYLENVAEGSTYPAVRAEQFLGAPIPSLNASDRTAFESIAAPLRQLVASAERETRTLAATRDALLTPLMSGTLRVRDAESAASAAGV